MRTQTPVLDMLLFSSNVWIFLALGFWETFWPPVNIKLAVLNFSIAAYSIYRCCLLLRDEHRRRGSQSDGVYANTGDGLPHA